MAKNFTSAVLAAFNDKRVEPEQRMVGGRFGYAFHRFPIKYGISAKDVILDSVIATNSLFKRFKGEKHGR